MPVRRLLSAFVLGCSVIWSSLASAQNVGGSIQGVVSDGTGATLPGANVVIRNIGTGDVRQIVTDAAGRYLVPVLPPGEYELTVSLTGFQTMERRGIALAIGQVAVVNLSLPVGGRQEQIVVTADANRIQLTNGAVSGLVGEREIRDLPLNGRSFQQLALLQPGVQAALAAGNDVVGGRTPKISINGARPEQNNFLLDGTDINNVYNKTPGSAAGVLLGVEAVLEFQVLTNAYSAEFGRSAGGVINAVTRSGPTPFTDRPSSSIATPRSMRATSSIHPRSQSPTSIAINLAASRAARSRATGRSSSAPMRGWSSAWASPASPRFPTTTPARAFCPRVRSRCTPRSLPTSSSCSRERTGVRSAAAPPNISFPTRSRPTNTSDKDASTIDSRTNDSLFVRYTYDHGAVDRIPTDKPPISIIVERTRNTYVTVEHQHVFSPAMLNVFRAGLNRSVSLADNLRTIDDPAVHVVDSRRSVRVSDDPRHGHGDGW